MDEEQVIPKTIDISINFYTSPDNNSTNVSFHTVDDELSVEEAVSYMKRALLAYGLTEIDVGRIVVIPEEVTE